MSLLPPAPGALARAAGPPADAPGRSCPLHYLYSPRDLARAPDLAAHTLYVIGGLYGNPQALDAVEALAALEAGPVTLLFNGDFHWFDHAPALFRDIDARVLAHQALRGNVETELASDDGDAGCGCAYPEWVPDPIVARSNAIEQRLRETARRDPGARTRLAALPMHQVVQVGDARVAVVHGDGVSLAGWGFARRALARPAGAARAAQWLEAAAADVFACTHTCEPLWMRLVHDGHAGVVINNGAAGMPNFSGEHRGVVTRVSVAPPLPDALYGGEVRGVHVHALALDYDRDAWWSLFTSLWPEGSDAHLSYAARIRDGGSLALDDAVMRAPEGWGLANA